MLKNYIKLSLLGIIACLTTTSISAQNPVVKIDFDQSAKISDVGEPNYTPWYVTGVSTASKVVEGITFTVNKGGKGNTLSPNWYKAGTQNPYYAKLVCDGLTVKDGTANDGGEIELKIRGLETGDHTLLVFLNAVDSPNGNTFSPIDISVDGKLIMDDVIPSVRATKTADAKSVYWSQK